MIKRLTSDWKEVRELVSAKVRETVTIFIPISFMIKKPVLFDVEINATKLIFSQTGEAVITHLTNRTEERALRWPSEDDLNGAAVALTRLQV